MSDGTTTRLTLGINAVGAVMGGAARHLPPFLHALRSARPEWTLQVWASDGVSTDGWPDGVIPATVQRLDPARRIAWETRQLTGALEASGADALLNLTNSGPLRSPIPSLLYQRNPLWFDPRWADRFRGKQLLEARARRLLACLQARAATAVLVPSSAMAEFLLHWPLWPRSTAIRVVPHAVDAGRFAFHERSWPPPGDRALHIVCVSHASRHKDQELLIDLAERFTRRGTDVKVSLTVDRDDDPSYVDELRSRAERLGLDGQVAFLGRVSDPESLYAAADVVISSSITESFGFPVFEAMAAGAPVVASDIPASRELAGPLARYFRPGDPDDAVRVIDDVLATPAAEITDRVHAGRARVEQFSWSRNASSVAAAVEACVGR